MPYITLKSIFVGDSKRAGPQVVLSAFEGEIDQLVYQLYGLSENEVKIVEGKD